MDKKSFFARMASSQAGEFAKKIWRRINPTEEQKQAEALAKAKKIVETVEKSDPQEVVGKIAQIERESERMSPFVAKSLIAGAGMLSLYPLSAIDGYVTGRFGEPNDAQTSPLITTTFASGVMDMFEPFGKSKANLISDTFVNNYNRGYAARFNNSSEQERKNKAIVSPHTRTGNLAKTESHQAVRTSFNEFRVEQGDAIGADDKGRAQTAANAASAAKGAEAAASATVAAESASAVAAQAPRIAALAASQAVSAKEQEAAQKAADAASATLSAAYAKAQAASAPELAALEQARIAAEKQQQLDAAAAKSEAAARADAIQRRRSKLLEFGG